MRRRTYEEISGNDGVDMSGSNYSSHEVVLEFVKTKLEESYKREESIKESATMQIAVFAFLITAIISLEIALYENGFRLFYLTLVFSSITIGTMLLAVLFAILSQWRMTRCHLPKASEVIKMINAVANEEKVVRGKDELIGDLADVADSMDDNNDKRTKMIVLTHALAIISIIEMFLFSFTIFIALTI